mgnify:CR=1 FL=1
MPAYTRRNRKGQIAYFGRCIMKEGVESFTGHIIYGFYMTQEYADYLEMWFIKEWKTLKTENGYNTTLGGRGIRRPRSLRTEEEKKKKSEKLKAVWKRKTPAQRARQIQPLIRAKKKRRLARGVIYGETKICPKPGCIHEGKVQLVSNFGKNKSRVDGYCTYCYDCNKEKKKYRNKPEIKAKFNAMKRERRKTPVGIVEEWVGYQKSVVRNKSTNKHLNEKVKQKGRHSQYEIVFKEAYERDANLQNLLKIQALVMRDELEEFEMEKKRIADCKKLSNSRIAKDGMKICYRKDCKYKGISQPIKKMPLEDALKAMTAVLLPRKN